MMNRGPKTRARVFDGSWGARGPKPKKEGVARKARGYKESGRPCD